ncbi:hypothetical protein K7432_000887 [Basidiobolus ranarum]|uniref:Uncharacterized protein n=1 Tax=Basidiobolus ranarum TaxID=34480 RepID=A0ABR2X3Y4_9FUNG
MSSKAKLNTSFESIKAQGIEAPFTQGVALSPLSIPTKFRASLSRRGRSNSAPSQTTNDGTLLGRNLKASQNMRSVSCNETLIKDNEYEIASPEFNNSPRLVPTLQNKNLEHSMVVQSVKYPTSPSRKNSRMRIMSDKLQQRLLGRKVSKDNISAPTLIMASSNVQTFDIEHPAQELNFSQRCSDSGSHHYNMSKAKSQNPYATKNSYGSISTSHIGMGSAKDQVRALTFAALNEHSNQQRPDIDSIGNLGAASEVGLPIYESEACELSLSHDVETLLKFLTTKTQDDMYRASIYDLYDYSSDDEDSEESSDPDFSLDLCLAQMMLNSSSPTPLFTQPVDVNTLVEELPQSALTPCN